MIKLKDKMKKDKILLAILFSPGSLTSTYEKSPRLRLHLIKGLKIQPYLLVRLDISQSNENKHVYCTREKFSYNYCIDVNGLFHEL